MAKFTPGPLAGAISGSIGGTTFSHNRYGPYMRRRAIPVTSTTEAALAAKARLTTTSQAWQGLTVAQKAAWNTWAAVNPITDPLGNAQVLTGHACYIMLSTRLIQAGGVAVALPPVEPAPSPLTYLALTADIGAGNVEFAFAATPLGADDLFQVFAAVVDSPGINYVENIFRFVAGGGLAQASPLEIQANVEGVFGALVVGQTLVLRVHVLDGVNGQKSAPLRDSALVIETV